MLRFAGLLCLLIGLVLSIGIATQTIKADGYFMLLVILAPSMSWSSEIFLQNRL